MDHTNFNASAPSDKTPRNPEFSAIFPKYKTLSEEKKVVTQKNIDFRPDAGFRRVCRGRLTFSKRVTSCTRSTTTRRNFSLLLFSMADDLFNGLTKILRDRDIPFDRDAIKFALNDPESQTAVREWMKEYLAPETLLTKDEATL